MDDNCEKTSWDFGGLWWWLAHIAMVVVSFWVGMKFATRCHSSEETS
ncbi:MAG TPA: hypothetical protein GXX30_06455 [Firmicutes bacterium]|nr:hypothetical protein [Candidatus Fermentithermobacillaceae bacterium]